MTVAKRNNVRGSGDGNATIIFTHGFGCDQNMWRLLAPAYGNKYCTVLVDLVGSGLSDLSAFDKEKYSTLQGHADDLLEVIDEFAQGPVIFVGHSVSAMIGMLADLSAPGKIAAHAMIGPSPCYVNDGDYVGGFERKDIDSLLQTLEGNYLGWSSTMAPAIMGSPEQPELGVELTNSFCRTDPEIAKHFARVTFLSDYPSFQPVNSSACSLPVSSCRTHRSSCSTNPSTRSMRARQRTCRARLRAGMLRRVLSSWFCTTWSKYASTSIRPCCWRDAASRGARLQRSLILRTDAGDGFSICETTLHS